MTAGPITDTSADAVRRRALRRMRTVATSLLVLAAIVFALTLHRDGFLGFVNAGAEASMVGAMADWFAVTALFKHPLGLPIPHTALIPRRKDDIGHSLEEFVGENFLAEDVLRDRIAVVQPALRIGTWLAEETNARALVDEASTVAAAALSRVRDDHIAELVNDVLVPRLSEEPIAPLLGGALEGALADNLHHGVVDLALVELHDWLAANQDTVTDVLGERAPWWIPTALRDPAAARIHLEIVRWVADIRDDPDHRAREALDKLLGELASDLQHDPATQQRAEKFKDRLLQHPQVIATSIELWDALRRALSSALRDDDSALRARLVEEATRFGERLRTDAELRERLQAVAADAVVYVVKRYGKEATAVITHTIERWDGREASRRIELHVGRDLQFIRINGTLVGGLVGVLIHAVTTLVG
ncbi:DUF445 domain-containing protein [Nocardioides sp. BP30]|uniref:DUF445 domain-containing protein n=1 Tax=Nocardioides sp. BP30 TaxID=3036374 RepID=UPI0024694B80|nr:DUF445 domain-containing protein [Nocardioides sp. BP30]WGL51321.1 DUF445 domain-containing protein [Nocardioides sp. BP30]